MPNGKTLGVDVKFALFTDIIEVVEIGDCLMTEGHNHGVVNCPFSDVLKSITFHLHDCN
jgi:hypothetical protein